MASSSPIEKGPSWKSWCQIYKGCFTTRFPLRKPTLQTSFILAVTVGDKQLVVTWVFYRCKDESQHFLVWKMNLGTSDFRCLRWGCLCGTSGRRVAVVCLRLSLPQTTNRSKWKLLGFGKPDIPKLIDCFWRAGLSNLVHITCRSWWQSYKAELGDLYFHSLLAVLGHGIFKNI